MRMFSLIAVLAVPVALAACTGPRRVDTSPPTVTYSYQYQSQLNDIQRRADTACHDQYGLGAVPVDHRRTSGGYEVVFACQ